MKSEPSTWRSSLLFVGIRANASGSLHVQAVRPRHPAATDDVFHQMVWSDANGPSDQRTSTVAVSQQAHFDTMAGLQDRIS